MSGDERTFTEAEHAALLTAAVKNETATLTEKVETLTGENTELQTKLDAAEAEKSTVTAERDQIKKEHEDFKAEQAEKEQIAERKEIRVKAVQDANDKLPEDYFTDERVQRWAELSEEAFGDFIETVKVAPTDPAKTRESAAFTGGKTPKAPAETPKSRAFTAPFRGAAAK